MTYQALGNRLKFISSFVLTLLVAGIFMLSLYSPQVGAREEDNVELNLYLGSWQGDIESGPNQTAPIVLHLLQEQDKIIATLDSPYQKAFGIPLKVAALSDKKLKLGNKELAIRFKGKLTEAIKGTLSVGDTDFAINFARQTPEQKAELVNLQSREQTPVPPFNYQVRELTVNNGEINLAATLTLPQGHGPFPTVILLSGTGPDDRDYSKFGHKRFWVLAHHLTNQGIAVLRFDERGVGDSSGDFYAANFDDFVSDIDAMTQLLKAIPEVDQEKLGLIGHSEGGMVATLNAIGNRDIRFLVLLATMADKKLGLSLQYQQIAEASGYDQVLFTQAVVSLEKLALNGATANELVAYYQRHYQQTMPLPEAMLQQTAAHFTSPGMLSFLGYQPELYLSLLEVPVLNLCGELDNYFDCQAHTETMQAIFKAAGNKHFTHHSYGQLNHYLQTASSGTMAEEANLTETLSPQVLSDVSQWILSHASINK